MKEKERTPKKKGKVDKEKPRERVKRRASEKKIFKTGAITCLTYYRNTK